MKSSDCFMEDIFDKVLKKFPDSFLLLSSDLENNIKAFLNFFSNYLDLISREEFTIQREVLLKTRKKIEALERQLCMYKNLI